MVSIGKSLRQRQRSSFFSRACHKRTIIAITAAALLMLCSSFLKQHRQQQHQQQQQLEQDLLQVLVPSTADSAKQEAKAHPLQTKDISPQNAGGAKTTEVQQAYEESKPLAGWIYEPKNVQFFWQKMGDRPFQREFYSQHLGQYKRIGPFNVNSIPSI